MAFAKAEASNAVAVQATERKSAHERLVELIDQTAIAARNMSLAKNAAQHEAMSLVFDELNEERCKLELELARLQSESGQQVNAEAEVAAAIDQLRQLPRLLENAEGSAKVCELLNRLNVRLFLRFATTQRGKRKFTRLQSGVMTAGAAPAPVAIYQGPTSRDRIPSLVDTTTETTQGSGTLRSVASGVTGRKVNQLGNSNRGDRI